MYHDSPIKYKKHDKLNRTQFAEAISKSMINIPKGRDSIVIGIMGGWGTGKSSLLNLIEYNIKDHVTIVKFNPWNYYSQQTLFSSFFDELTNTLNFNNQIKTKFQKYKNKIYAAGISLGSSVVPQVGALTNFISDSETNTLNNIKDELNSVFRKQRKTVIIIDDIDRLNPDEVKQIFQLVKSLADFPNLIYILAFDKDYVNYALKDWNIDDKRRPSEDFIDKIIQVPLTIPKFDGEDLFKIFESKFNKILNLHDVDINNLNIHQLYFELYPYFKNIRDINRFCNALDFYLYSVDKEVWIYDFALITALQIFEKDTYDEIKYNKDLLTGDFNFIMGDVDFEKIFAKDLECFLKDLFKNLNFKNETAVKHILSDLFPKVKSIVNRSYTPESKLSVKRKQCGIMEKEYFDLYFTFDNTNKLSKSRINSLIKSANNNEKVLKENIFKIKKIKLLDSLIRQLEYHTNEFSELGIRNLITVFINSYKKLFTSDETESENKKIERGINLLFNLFKGSKLSDENFVDVIYKSEDNYFKICLIWEICNSNLIKEEKILKLKNNASEFLTELFEKTELSKIEHVKSNIWFWKYFTDFETTNDYINNNFDDNEIIILISEFKKRDNIKQKDKIEYDSLSGIVDLNSVKKRFEAISSSNSERNDVVDLFLEEYPNQ